jgi:hypothetical protein
MIGAKRKTTVILTVLPPTGVLTVDGMDGDKVWPIIGVYRPKRRDGFAITVWPLVITVQWGK